jgi:hypothetical protein
MGIPEPVLFRAGEARNKKEVVFFWSGCIAPELCFSDPSEARFVVHVLIELVDITAH